ncbi:MAG: DUF2130 domain-containing protein [candidate division WOR-3 bacterium]|nr:DUF2130 domain-containing protein [candidate division WOR-3 bacterium]MCX7837215.1 DUF2130 domain-containing protein [candidate division WOR-3 bacterium]
MNENIIICPNCKTKINVNEILYQQIEEKIRINYEKKLKEEILTERAKLRKSLKEELEKEQEELINRLKTELEEKSKKVKEIYILQAELEKLKREKEENEAKIRLEMEKSFSERLNEEKRRIQTQIEEQIFLKLREKDKIIEDLKNQLEEAKRKAEMGSIQLKGEVQEIEIEKLLKSLYPNDKIQEIKKGQKGADVLQIVINNQGEECGKIYYESKRTKEFNYDWLRKLREDNLEMKADILVLVTEAMPEKENKFFFEDGVWVCNFFELKPVSYILRHFLLEINNIETIHKGKETKMELLYNYLTSNEFKNQFLAIVEGFVELQKSYLEERRKMEALWAKREEHLRKILDNAARFYGKIKGIAGKTLPEIEIFEDRKEIPLL